MLGHNAERVVELARMYQNVSGMKNTLEHYQDNSSIYLTNINNAIYNMDSLLTDIENEINRIAP